MLVRGTALYYMYGHLAMGTINIARLALVTTDIIR